MLGAGLKDRDDGDDSYPTLSPFHSQALSHALSHEIQTTTLCNRFLPQLHRQREKFLCPN